MFPSQRKKNRLATNQIHIDSLNDNQSSLKVVDFNENSGSQHKSKQTSDNNLVQVKTKETPINSRVSNPLSQNYPSDMMLTPTPISARKRAEKPALLDSMQKVKEESEDYDQRIREFFEINHGNTLMAQNLGVKRPSFMSVFRLSNKFKRASQKTKADRMRASNGKLVMMPSIMAIAQVKESMKHIEKKRESFLKQLEQNIISPVSQHKYSTNLDPTKANEGVTTVIHTGQKNNINQQRNNEARKVDQNLESSPVPIKLGHQQVNIFQGHKKSDTLIEREKVMIEQFKNQIEQQQSNSPTKILKPSLKQSNLLQSKEYLKSIKLNPDEDPQQDTGFSLNKRPKEGLFVYSTKLIRDENLSDFLLTMCDENIAKFSITNGELTDVGIVYISEFFQKKGNLHVLKLYNNIMRTNITNDSELAYIMNGTPSLANCIKANRKLICLELHGFYLHQSSFPQLIDALYYCHNLKRLQFSNNNIQDAGVVQLCKLLDYDDEFNEIQLEQLTIYNNNVTDVGAIEIARVLSQDSKLKILNLQMNFIKDKGGQAFVDLIQDGTLKDIWKIILSDNDCTENFKKKVKKIDAIII